MKKLEHFFLTLGIILLLTVGTGIFIPRYISKKSNFIGKVNSHIYADNSSDKIISHEEAKTCWYMLDSGAPGPFLAFQNLITQRMEIIKTENLGDYCGRCDIRLYTLFNIKTLDGNIHHGCP